jgi:hypothetical protein
MPLVSIGGDRNRFLSLAWANPRVRRLSAVLVLISGLGILTTTWAFSNPPGAAPDEPTSYLKAMGTALGQWVPQHVTVVVHSKRDRFNAANFGAFEIPARFVPDPHWACNRVSPNSAHCLLAQFSEPDSSGSANEKLVSYVAWYPPLVPFVLGSVGRLGDSSDAALYLGRVASVIICMLLLSTALILVSADAGWALLGLLAAVSPMVIFLSTSMSADGIEAAAAVSHAVVITRVIAGDRRKIIWPAYFITGLPLAVSRQLGPIWIGLGIALMVGMLGIRGTRVAVQRQRRGDRFAMLVVFAAAASTAVWDIAVERPASAPLSRVLGNLLTGLTNTQSFPNQFVGVFGWLDTPLPHFAYGVAEVIYAIIIVSALILGSNRERICIAATAAAALLIPAIVDATSLLPFRIGIEERQFIPVTAMLLVLCGWIVQEHRGDISRRLPETRRIFGVVGVASSIYLTSLWFLGWLVSSHKSANGRNGSWSFLLHPQWSPPLGWEPWLVLAIIGVVLACAGAVGEFVLSSDEGRRNQQNTLDRV